MKRYVMRCILLFLLMSCSEKSTDPTPVPDPSILEKLQNLPGVTVTELPPTAHFDKIFELAFTQPVDHTNPNSPTFQQKAYIGHVDEALPVALETAGYSRDSFKTRELAPAMQCNQITIEHRYNGASKPSQPDWQYLTIKQSADDLHAIVELLKPIYSGSWVSSGRSKGGETALFYRRFYPDDVDATVAFVAPILYSERDTRINDYMNTVGTPDCRAKIKSFQKAVLLKKDSLAAMLPGYLAFVNTTFNENFSFAFADTMVINLAASEYPFEFWGSTSHNCSSIPDSSANAATFFTHLSEVMNIILFYTDYAIDFWEAWYYQAQTEIGDFRHDTSHLSPLLGDVDEYYNFQEPLIFNPAAMQDVDQWIQSEGEKIILIYGEEDPWSAAQFSSRNANVYKIINPGTKHGTAVSDLNSTDRDFVVTKLQEWLNYSSISFNRERNTLAPLPHPIDKLPYCLPEIKKERPAAILQRGVL